MCMKVFFLIMIHFCINGVIATCIIPVDRVTSLTSELLVRKEMFSEHTWPSVHRHCGFVVLTNSSASFCLVKYVKYMWMSENKTTKNVVLVPKGFGEALQMTLLH